MSNCIDWLFFLPITEAPWEQRQFYECNILSDELDNVVKLLEIYLSRENIVDGQANIFAKEALKRRQKDNYVNTSFPSAWKKIILKRDRRFIEFFADIIEQDWGSRPLLSSGASGLLPT